MEMPQLNRNQRRRRRRKAAGAQANQNANGENQEATPKLTPYQGKRRCFGHFKCEDCNCSWSSANSWANTWQKCNRCNAKIYPFQQHRLWRGKKDRNEDKAHPANLCGKCEQVGNCRRLKVAVIDELMQRLHI